MIGKGASAMTIEATTKKCLIESFNTFEEKVSSTYSFINGDKVLP